jgi:hypothetical protein
MYSTINIDGKADLISLEKQPAYGFKGILLENIRPHISSKYLQDPTHPVSAIRRRAANLQTNDAESVTSVGIQKHLMGLKSMDLICQTGSLA